MWHYILLCSIVFYMMFSLYMAMKFERIWKSKDPYQIFRISRWALITYFGWSYVNRAHRERHMGTYNTQTYENLKYTIKSHLETLNSYLKDIYKPSHPRAFCWLTMNGLLILSTSPDGPQTGVQLLFYTPHRPPINWMKRPVSRKVGNAKSCSENYGSRSDKFIHSVHPAR